MIETLKMFEFGSWRDEFVRCRRVTRDVNRRYGQYAVSMERAVRHEKISVGWEADYARKLETSS